MSSTVNRSSHYSTDRIIRKVFSIYKNGIGRFVIAYLGRIVEAQLGSSSPKL